MLGGYSGTNRMKLIIISIMIVVVLAAETLAQLPPVAVPRVAPHLKRDRTQRIVYPKIIQREDERIIDEELIGMLSQYLGKINRKNLSTNR